MKKILCVTLSILMLILVFPTMIFAEETVCTVSKNGETAVGYTSFDSAVASLTAGNTYVIEILDNVSLTGANYISKHADTTINGNGKTLTVSNNDGIFCDNIGMYVLNINDLTINATSKVLFRCNWWNQNATKVTTLNGCTINNTTTDIGDGLFTLGGNYTNDKYTLNLEDCEINANNEAVLFVCNQGERVVNITDTKITHNYGMGTWNAAAAVRVQAGGSGFDVTLNIKGNSEIISCPTASGISNMTNIIYVRGEDSPKVTVNFSENNNGDVPMLFMNLENTEVNQARTNNSFIHDESSFKFVTVNGNVSLKVSAFAAQKGVILPEPNTEATFLGWSSVDGLYKAGAYLNANADQDIFFFAAFIDADSFKMLSGAAIKVSEPYSIRFDAEISDALVASLGDNAEYGMWIMPTEFLSGKTFTFADLYDGEYLDIQLSMLEDKNDSNVYGAAITNISKSATGVNMKFSARAYIIVTYADGQKNYIYTDYSDTDNVRSLADVAKSYAASGVTDNAVINNIISLAG